MPTDEQQVVIQRSFRVGPRILFAPMDAKRIFRGPLLWIVLAVLLVLLGSQLFTGFSGPKSVDTWQAISYIQGNQAKSATLVDKEQRIELTLQDGSKVTSEYIDGQGVKLQEQLQAQEGFPVNCRTATTLRFRERTC